MSYAFSMLAGASDSLPRPRRPLPAWLSGACASAAPIVAFVVLWQCVVTAGLAPSEILVDPLAVSRSLLDLLGDGQLVRALLVSLSRMLSGFAIGGVGGVVIGLATGASSWIDRLSGPLFQALRQIPVLAFLPILILTAGVGEWFKIVAVAIAVLFPIALAVRDAVRSLPATYLDVAEIFRLRLLVRVTHLYLPGIIPGLFAGARLALTRGWMVLVAAELMSGDSGIGQMMELGRQTFRMDIVMVGIVATGTIGFLFDRGMRLLQARLLRWVPA